VNYDFSGIPQMGVLVCGPMIYEWNARFTK